MHSTPEFLAQYNALTGGVGIAELNGRTILAITGSDRVQFLHAFSTNDIKKLTPGRGCEAFITSPQGKTLGHALILCEPDRVMLDTSPGQAAALIAHFEKYIITEDVLFTDISAELTDIVLAGREAAALLEVIGTANPPTGYLEHSRINVAGRSAVLQRVEYALPDSYFVRAAVDDASAIIASLRDAGAVLCESAAVESARLEAGFPLFGHDITPENLPQEVARDAKAISFTKGCYLGQETVARIDALGHVNRQLVGLKFDCVEAPFHEMCLLASDRDKEVGHVTSAAWSPRLRAFLALAYVRRDHAKPGLAVSSAAGAAEVIKLPVA